MVKLSGIFENFKDIEKIPVEDINKWLKNKLEVHALTNFIANRIQFPQTIPVTNEDLEIDLAILREIIRRQNSFLYDPKQQKLIIPLNLSERFPPLFKLVCALLDVLSLGELTKIFMQEKSKLTLLGSVVSPILRYGEGSININFANQSRLLTAGSITLLPVREDKITLKIGNDRELIVYGGQLGVLIHFNRKG